MSESQWRFPVLIWGSWLLLTLFLRAGPAHIRDQIQSVLMLATGTVLKLPSTRDDVANASTGREPTLNSSERNALHLLQAENRELAKKIAELHLENQHLQRSAAPFAENASKPLVKLDAVPARVIGQRGDVLSESLELLISVGKSQGITERELVLSGQGLLIDQGTSAGLAPDQMITAGRGLFGRTVEVGRLTTLVQPVTSPTFRVAVRIIRRSPLGIVQGPQGIMAGTGNGCRLEEVNATEAVAAGDEVYTDRLVSPGAEPIYCGRIIRAEAGSADIHWKIDVEPLHSSSSLPAKLYVLRSTIDSQR